MVEYKERRGEMDKKSTKKKTEKKNKNLAVIIASAVAAVALIVVVIALANFKLRVPEEINDDYFVSDGSKIVVSLNDEMASFVDEEIEPSITHIVYYYSGDKINNRKYFFVYNDEEEASMASEEIGDDYEWASSKELNGKYLIFQDDSDSYKGMSVKELKSAIERMKAVDSAL